MDKNPSSVEAKQIQSCKVCGKAHGFDKKGGACATCDKCGLQICRTCYKFLCNMNKLCPQCHTPYERQDGSLLVSSDEDDTEDGWETDFECIQTSSVPRKAPYSELHRSGRDKKDNAAPFLSRVGSSPMDVSAKEKAWKEKKILAESSSRNPYRRIDSFPPSNISENTAGSVSSASSFGHGVGATGRLSVQATLPRNLEESWLISSGSLRERLMQWKFAQEATGQLSVESLHDPSWFLSSRSLRERLLQWKSVRETASRLSVESTLRDDPESVWLTSSKSLRERLLKWKLVRESSGRSSAQSTQENDPESSWLLSSKSLRERLLKWKKAQEISGSQLDKKTKKEWVLSKRSMRERLLKWKLAQEDVSSIEDVELEQLDIDSEHLQHLSRKVQVRPSKINPFRVMVLFRLVVTGFFFWYRLTNPVSNAFGLWLASVLCELWFCFSWMLEQFPKWCPINRETYLERLCWRYNMPGNPCELAPIDVFVSTADSMKEPPLVMANCVLSILSVDYPVDKISCYVSDDGASLLALEVLLETCEFARKWVPFCKRFDIEPRSPEHYFLQKVDLLKYSIFPTFTKERSIMKRQYEEFKILVSDLQSKFQKASPDGFSMKDGTPWPGNNAFDHPGMIQILLGRGRTHDGDNTGLPQLVYVSREKHPSYSHNRKAGAMNALVRVSAVITNAPFILNLDCNHYLNNSKAFLEAMCFMMDPNIMDKVCYVQFPERFDGIDESDRYANHNTIFYNVIMKGLDGIQGPVYSGTGCFFNRKALYGYEPLVEQRWRRKRKKFPTEQSGYGFSPYIFWEQSSSLLNNLERQFPSATVGLEKCFGQSAIFLSSTLVDDDRVSRSASPDSLLREAIHLLSCDYEDNTSWGREIGWMYGSLIGDLLTGFKMHAKGWRSIYCMPASPAFRGSAPINLSDRLSQLLRCAFSSVEILFSRHCPIWYRSSGRLKWRQRVAYINATIYPLSSVPLVIYCIIPAICLLTGKFIIPQNDRLISLWIPLVFLSCVATWFAEVRCGDLGTQEWWRNHQIWVISGVSSHLFALFQGLIKAVTGISTHATVMAKRFPDVEFKELYAFKWTSLLIVPTTLILINIWAIVAGTCFVVNTGYGTLRMLIAKIFFACWVLLHLYPFLRGLLVREHRIPGIVILWSLFLAILFSVAWERMNPFITRFRGPDRRACGINC